MLSVRHGAQAIDFYKAAFGAPESFRSHAHFNFSPESLGEGTVRMVMVVEDPDAVFNRAVAAGAKVVVPVDDRYGWRIGRAVDPYGHHWEIGKPLS